MARQQPTRVPAAVLPPCRMTLAPGGSVLARYTDRPIRARDARCLCQRFGSIENLLCGEDAEDLVLRFGGQDVGRQVRGNPARAASQQDRRAMARLVAAPGGLQSLRPVRLHLKPAGLAPVPRRLPPATASWPPSGWRPLASGRREGSSQDGSATAKACHPAQLRSPRLVRSGNSAPTDAVPTPPSRRRPASRNPNPPGDEACNQRRRVELRVVSQRNPNPPGDEACNPPADRFRADAPTPSARARSHDAPHPTPAETSVSEPGPPPTERPAPFRPARVGHEGHDPRPDRANNHGSDSQLETSTRPRALTWPRLPRRRSPAKIFPPSPEPLQAGTAKKAA